MDDTELLKKLSVIPSPAFVADEARLADNLAQLAAIKAQTGAEIMYAVKACPLHPLFRQISQVLDGSTASGLYEARLGLDAFGKQIHVYCPAYEQAEIDNLLALGQKLHIYFNSVGQLNKYAPQVRAASQQHHIGLRINPGLSLTDLAKYDPCRNGSHLGVPLNQLDQVEWPLVDVLHGHALCQNMAEDSARLIDHVADCLAPWLPKVQAMNFGGGHFITHSDYKADLLVSALNRFAERYPQVTRILEPGAAIVYDAGYLVSTVLDIMENDGVKTAILNVSANCHIPDVIKAEVRMPIIGAAERGVLAHDYTLAARTCMASDVWGDYSFAQPLQPGDRIIMRDALQYGLGEANWFNGQPRPSYGMLKRDGSYELFCAFEYEDFRAASGGPIRPVGGNQGAVRTSQSIL